MFYKFHFGGFLREIFYLSKFLFFDFFWGKKKKSVFMKFRFLSNIHKKNFFETLTFSAKGM
jgi:hypothetical protein